MFRHPRFRSIIAMLLAFCLASASLWSYGAEATADALSDEIAHFFPPRVNCLIRVWPTSIAIRAATHNPI